MSVLCEGVRKKIEKKKTNPPPTHTQRNTTHNTQHKTQNTQRSFAKFDQVKKLIWQVERISELCTLEVGGQKSLDTAGNFFKVVNSGGAALSQKKKVRKTITGSIDRGGSFRLGKDDRRASDPANIRGERKERSLSEGEESNRSLALVKPHANTVL